MKHVVLATAGHIDHGKTELVRALTGIDTDRLPEEKARGITIDLGFAHLELGGRRVALIDVPGHERFVKNMLAGVGGIDLALVVVASDESVMPQTREHLAILGLLGVPSGVVALTKTDLVDAETLDLARLEVADLVRGTFLEGAPVVPVSARTGAGIEALRAALAEASASVTARDPAGPFRLHVDRAFSIRGFGSVVTGTVVSGTIRTGSEVEISPGGERAKIRGIETHGEDVEEVAAGARAALNLAGVDLDALERGQQLLTPGLFRPSSLLDVRLRILAGAKGEMRDLARVRLHLGAAEVLARVRLLGRGGAGLEPGASGWAQLRLEAPIVAWPGDRFILRSYSPMTTVGGGEVVDPLPEKHRGRTEGVVAWLERLAAATPAGRLERIVERAGRDGVTLGDLVARSGRLRAEVESDLTASRGLVSVSGAEPRYIAAAPWRALRDEALSLLAGLHRREPLGAGMPREELRGRLHLEEGALARQLLDGLVTDGSIRLDGDLASLASHRVSLSDAERDTKDRIEQAFRAGGLNPPSSRDVLAALGPAKPLGEKLVGMLVREGRLVLVPGGLHFHAEAVAEARRRLAAAAGGGRPFTVPEFKEWTGTSRKFAIPLLEHLDAQRFTRRQGEARVLVGS